MTAKAISSKEAGDIIGTAGGTIFTAVFRKRTDSKFRKMVCRLHVKKGVTGRGMSYNPKERNLLTVYDMQKNEFRHISMDRLVLLKVKGVTYRVKQA